MTSLRTFLLLAFATFITAKTDLAGCTSSKVVVNGGASLLWYVPSDGEICDFLDCGGGRAPVKTDVPGCAAYTGNAAYMPSFLPGYGSEPASMPTGFFPPNAVPTTPSSFPTPSFPSPSWMTSTAAATTIPPATSISLSDTTTTLGAAGPGTTDTASLVTSALIFDTSAASESVSNMITVTTSTPSQASANAAATYRAKGKDIWMAAVGAAAGFAIL